MPLKRRKAAAVSDSRVRGPKRAKTNDPDSSSEQEFVNESRNSSTKKLTRSQRREREEEQTKQESIHEEQKSEIVNSSRSKAKRRCRSNGYVDILENSSNKDEFSTRNERAIPQKAKGQTHSRKGRCNEDATSARDSSDVQAVTKVDLPEEDEVINQSSSESEWEEVQDGNPETDEDDREPVIPKEGVQITIDLPESQGKRRNKKEFDIAAYFRRVANRLRKELREGIHKVHLLCLLASGFWIEGALGNNIVKAFALSLIPQELIIIDQGQAKKESLTKLLDWFRREFKLDANQKRAESLSTDVHYIIQGFQEHQTCSKTVYVCMLLACIRTAGYNARFVWSFQPCPYKAPLVEAKSSGKLKSDNVKTTLDVASTSPVGAQVQGTQKRKKSVSSTIDDTYNSLKKETVEPLAVNDIDVVVKNSRNDKMGDGRQRRSLRCSQRSKVDYSEDKNDESDLEIVECQDSKKRNSKNKTCSKKPKEKQADLDDDFEVVTVEVRKPRPVTGMCFKLVCA